MERLIVVKKTKEVEELEDKDKTTKLASKARKGNVKAYGTLIGIYKEYLYRMAFSWMKNEDVALDVVGECILKGFEKIHLLKEPAYFKTWITRILLNIAKDYLKKTIPMEQIGDLQIPEDESGISFEEKMDLYDALDHLSNQYREILTLKYFDDMKIKEIAEIMEMPEGSVKAYLSRAKKELREYLKEDYIYGISYR